MAEILQHPESEEKFSEWVLPIAHGIVEIKSTNGEPLTAERANFMLDAAKNELWNMLNERNQRHNDE